MLETMYHLIPLFQIHCRDFL